MWKEQLSDIREKIESDERKSPDIKVRFKTAKVKAKNKTRGSGATKPQKKSSLKHKGKKESKNGVLSGLGIKTVKKPKIKKSKNKKRRSAYVEPPFVPIGGKKPKTTNTPEIIADKYKFDVNLESFERPKRDECDSILASENSYKLVFSNHEMNSNDGRKSKELVIGLDFGTAFTKVVIGETTYAHVIDFEGYGFLLPSKLNVDTSGLCSIDKSKTDFEFLDLKLPLLLKHSNNSDHVVVVAFFAKVLTRCRLWVKDSIYSGLDIDWLINAGLPTESYHDKRLEELYKNILQAAWILSYSDDITLQGANAALDELKTGNSTIALKYKLDDESLHLFPEFAAQIVGYVQSPSRREFSHLLIDIGAGTFDVAIFIVTNNNGEWLFETAAKDIRTLGADVLAKHRINCSPNEIDFSLFLNFPTDKEFADLLGVYDGELNKIDKPFGKQINRSLNKVISEVAGGYKFGDDITTFVCGGGSKISLYKNEVDIVANRYPLNLLSLPVPERLRATSLHKDEYQRLSVAYGLSFDPFNIGNVIARKVLKKSAEISAIKSLDYTLNPGN